RQLPRAGQQHSAARIGDREIQQPARSRAGRERSEAVAAAGEKSRAANPRRPLQSPGPGDEVAERKSGHPKPARRYAASTVRFKPTAFVTATSVDKRGL